MFHSNNIMNFIMTPSRERKKKKEKGKSTIIQEIDLLEWNLAGALQSNLAA